MPIQEVSPAEIERLGLAPPPKPESAPDTAPDMTVREATPEEVQGLTPPPPTQPSGPAEPPSSLQPSPREVAEREEDRFTGTLRQGFRLADAERRSPLEVAAEEGGVEMGPGVPAAARVLEGFAADDKNVQLALKLGLERAFGEEVPVRYGEKTGRLEWKNPVNDKWTLANPPGLDLGDMSAFAGEGMLLATETGGALVGTAGGPVTTVAGLAFGAFVGELARLQIGRANGINQDMEDFDLIREAAKRTGITVTAGLAGEKLIRVGRTMLARMRGQGSLPAKLGEYEEAVGTGLDDIAEARTRIQARTGETLPLTPGQVTDEPLVQSTQGQLVRRSDGAAIRDTYAEQQRIMGEFESSVKAPFLAPRRDEPIDIVGRDIQAKARKAPNKGIATVEAQTEEARVAALNAAELATRGEMSPTLANQMAREELQTGRDMVQAQFGRDYARINEMAGGAKVDLEPFRQVAKKWDKEIKRDILPLLTEEDGKLFSTAAKAYTKEVEGLEFGAENILTPVTKLVSEPASFGSVQRTLSALRREIRLAKKGVGARTDFKALDELREALIISRDRALRGRPELQRQIDNVEASYARARRLVDRSLVGDILRKVEGGGYSLRDEFVIDRILTRPSGAKQVAQVLNDPEYSSFKEGLGPIRAGILGKYRKDVIDPDTGIAIPAKHVTWMGQRRESLKHFFSEDEIARLDKSRDAAVMYRDITKRNEQVVKKINQSFAMKLNNWDSTEVLQKTFKPQAVNNVRRLKRILGDTSPEWQSYQAAAMRKLWSDHSSWDKAAATFKLDEKKLAKLMESQDEIGLLQATFGKDLVDDMRTITTALTAANRKPAATMSDYVNEITGRQQTALNSLLRVYYAPLSLRGRMLTAGVRLRGKAAERALIRAFSDAEEFRRLAQLAKVKPGSKKARIILGGMGATILGFNPPSDEIEP